MKNPRTISQFFLFSFISLSLALGTFLLNACHKTEADGDTIKVGTIAGPETQLMETAKEVAKKKYNLNIKIVQFTEYMTPNEALADGSIDANVFQHLPYLEEAIKANHYKIVSIGRTFIYPIAIYSKKLKALTELKEGAVVAIPNDPSNEARALLLLAEAHLITLKPNVGVTVTTADILDNPKKLQIREINAAQIPRVLDDVDLAVINTNYASLMGLLPSRDGLFIESSDSPYANIIAVREKDKDNPLFQKLIQALQSDEVVEKAEKIFKNQAIPAWQ
jgi:D-methionine transport system substrate-binding protein